ncbi:AAA family ATPase [Microcystis wesenbergii FACHB-1317]|jgi:predicted ATPase|uniref:AAA family ATPase n=1 Tax=Microcystis TaxID=1125 RepID=UPI000E37A42D|nr:MULTISPECIES: AAA family ATPase [Microcystis]NCQ92006.1 AAA family ATPase [Microcystis aeruginosa LG13-13]NCR05225.1 AAA family ATPase [Microcystis aeruginosa LG13-03]NCR63473.1 AAA family ATPase [Microcystis aeruginosa LG11-05]NCR73426.1 AAA family ATPase [Microcystis aeruginosa LG13-12]REJ58623.1 MAG: ATPase [Microcystis aeruginosa TA09]
MITYIKIHGFKSFHNFEMVFTPLTVVAGVNASGKSNLFDALQLLARLAEVDLKTAFSEQRGHPSELFTQYDEDDYATEMEFIVEMLVNRKVKDNWGGEVDLKYTRLRYQLKIKRESNISGFENLYIVDERLENLKHNEDNWVKNYIPKTVLETWRPKVTGRRAIPYIKTEDKSGIATIVVHQDGQAGNKKVFPAKNASQTVLSSINTIDFQHILAAKQEMLSWKFMQLNPEDLREPTRQDLGIRDTITASGKNLAAALFRIKQDDEYTLTAISRDLNNLLPNLTEVNVYDDKANRQFIIKVKGDDGREFSSRVLSEGTLRLLTLCVLQYDQQHTGLLCFEEPENGIHPFRIEAMARLLKELTVDFKDTEMPLRQVIVNTHSPVLVSQLINWQDDENVSIWLSQLTNRISTIEGKRIKMKSSNFHPVIKENKKQLTLFYSENEAKLTLSEVVEYLKTADAESAIKNIKNQPNQLT